MTYYFASIVKQIDFIKAIGFLPKENAKDIFIKKYLNDYAIEIDVAKQTFYFGGKIKVGEKDTQNITKPEDWVVLECVDRLLTKGYKPDNIRLEKSYPAGHGVSKFLDICVTKDDGIEYLLIECKTYGNEFEKAFTRLKKDGGQLFTYFKFTNQADIIALYASDIKGNEIVYSNQIIKIEEEYRTGGKDDFFDKWNKLTKDNGLFEEWVNAYNFKSKAITLKQLKPIGQTDSNFIFIRFLEILRNNVVSDEGNAFNKIFTLFLCKVYDEKSCKEDDELKFQWLEGIDDDVSFQLRLTDLYKSGMLEFLEKEVSDFDNDSFENKFKHLKQEDKKELLQTIHKLRLEKNNEFAIKEVFDHHSFKENAKVVKQVVELLQGYRIRYNKRQQYLSDFFELLLTTGLKQKVGQYFTPVPIAQFIIKSLPIEQLVNGKLEKGESSNLLPYIIDYAAGSGHFLTESMHEIQRVIDNKNAKDFIPATAKKIRSWQDDHFDWATQYVYGIEKDYRLVKVGKVGCYLHGDGLANVILSDGLANFKHPEYKGKLSITEKEFERENRQFDVVLSNPPYSVPAFKPNGRNYYTEKDYTLYNNISDLSGQIESLFVERTKHLLKDGGLAGVILPSSILSSEGVYAKTREIILQSFTVISIVELGGKTFMATDTKTVVLFLRRRNNYESINIKKGVEQFFVNKNDVTLGGVENSIQLYINHVWNIDITKQMVFLSDYKTLLEKEPNDTILHHEIFIDYKKKIKTKTDKEFYDSILKNEFEKIYYFILAYKQKVVLVKSGSKNVEQKFLGYKYSDARGKQGIHPIQKGKHIEDCTLLFNPALCDDETKISTYIYKAFNGDFETPINDALKKHIDRVNLIDILVFDRANFEKAINVNSKKKVKTVSKYSTTSLENIASIQSGLWEGKTPPFQKAKVLRNTNFKDNNGKLNYEDVAEIDVELKQLSERKLEYGDIVLEKSGGSDTQAIGRVVLFEKKNNEIYSYSNFCSRIRVIDKSKILTVYLWAFLNEFYKKGGTIPLQNGVRLLNIDMDGYKKTQIPLPPLSIQQKIVDEIEVLETKENNAKQEIEALKGDIAKVIENSNGTLTRLQDITTKIGSGATPLGGEGVYKSAGITLIRSQNVYDNEFIENGLAFIDEAQASKLNNVTVEANDILFNITGASIARCTIVPDKYLPARVNQHVSIIRLNDKAIPKYVQSILVSEIYKNKLLEIGEGSTSREAITKAQLENFQIPLPSIKEQQKIVTQIQKIEEQINKLQTIIANIPKQKEAVLKKYL